MDRTDKVAAQVRDVLLEALALQKLHSVPLSRSVVHITEVRMSPDLKLAKIYFEPFRSEDAQAVLQMFKAAKGELKRILADKLRLKFTPDLTFYQDDRFETARAIETILPAQKSE